jgi:hypothetical protein
MSRTFPSSWRSKIGTFLRLHNLNLFESNRPDHRRHITFLFNTHEHSRTDLSFLFLQPAFRTLPQNIIFIHELVAALLTHKPAQIGGLFSGHEHLL